MSEVKSSDPAVQTFQASPVSSPQPKSDYARLIEAVLMETKIPCAFISILATISTWPSSTANTTSIPTATSTTTTRASKKPLSTNLRPCPRP